MNPGPLSYWPRSGRSRILVEGPSRGLTGRVLPPPPASISLPPPPPQAGEDMCDLPHSPGGGRLFPLQGDYSAFLYFGSGGTRQTSGSEALPEASTAKISMSP